MVEIASVEDFKGRGWRTPRARVESAYAPGEFRLTREDVPKLYAALTEAFTIFEREFSVSD